MKAIWKYRLEVVDEQWIQVPRGAKPLSVQVQDGQVCLWCLVDTLKPNTGNLFVGIVGTGHEVKDLPEDSFVGTFQLYDGAFVGHVFAFRI